MKIKTRIDRNKYIWQTMLMFLVSRIYCFIKWSGWTSQSVSWKLLLQSKPDKLWHFEWGIRSLGFAGSRRLLGLFVFVCTVWLYGQMSLVVRGASHQSYGVWQRIMSQRDLLLYTNAELCLKGNLTVYLSLLIHSVMTQAEKKLNNIYCCHGVVPLLDFSTIVKSSVLNF